MLLLMASTSHLIRLLMHCFVTFNYANVLGQVRLRGVQFSVRTSGWTKNFLQNKNNLTCLISTPVVQFNLTF